MGFKKLMKLWLMLITITYIVLGASAIDISAVVVDEENVKYKIKRGIGYTGCDWGITEDGILMITGKGDPKLNLDEYHNYFDIPWAIVPGQGVLYADPEISVKDITSIYISPTVTPENMDYWFSDLSYLVEFGDIPDGVTSCKNTFASRNLTKIGNIPDSVVDCSFMFSECGLKEAPELPKNLKTARGMFKNCYNLEETPLIPSSVKDCSYMFSGCNSLTESPILPEGVTDCSGLLQNCTWLEQPISLPSSVIKIDYMYDGCINLKTLPTLPKNITSVEGLIRGCTSLGKFLEIPSNVKNISYLYEGWNITTAPTIPEGVTEAKGLFKNCVNLVNVPELPDSIKDCSEMFFDCTSLVSVPNIPSSSTTCNSMFSGCINLVGSPSIPSNVIDCSYMFKNCSSLSTVFNIPDSAVNTKYMFRGCTSLASVPELPSSLNDCTWMFADCDSITETPLEFNGGVKCDYMFYNCDNLVKVNYLPDTIKSCVCMFEYCKSLETVNSLPSNAEDCYYMFRDCVKLSSIVDIPEMVKRSEGMFDNCTSLVIAPSMPDSITNCRYMFSDCSSLQVVPRMPSNPLDCEYMFYNCKNLMYVPEVPNSVEDCNHMFFGCESLEVAPVLRSSKAWYYNIFSGCTNLKCVILDMNEFEHKYENSYIVFPSKEYVDNIDVYYTSNSSEEVAKTFIMDAKNVTIEGEYTLGIIDHPSSYEVLPNSQDLFFKFNVRNIGGTYEWYIASDLDSKGERIVGSDYQFHNISKSDVTLDLHNKYIYCVFKDYWGNTLTSDRALIQVVALPTVPTISTDLNCDDWVTSDLTISLIDSNIFGDISNVAYKYSFDKGDTWLDYSEPLVWDTDSSNVNILAKAYNKNHPTFFTDTTEFSFKYDGTKPYITDSWQTSGAADEKGIYIRGKDSLSGIASYGVSTSSDIEPLEWYTDDIIPVDDYGIYYAWVKDNAGNIRCYEDPVKVLRGYLYEYVTANDVNVVYDGEGHTGSVYCDGGTITYGKDESDFDCSLDEAPTFTNVGTYKVYYKVSKDGFWDFRNSYDVVITKAQGSITFSIADILIGSQLNPIVETTNDAPYSIYYKKKGADDSTYRTVAPKSAGDYVAYVSIREVDNYFGVEATTEFSIYDYTLDRPPVLPISSIEVSYSTEKVRDIPYKLPKDWVWEDGVEDIDLIIDGVVTVTARYVGSDAVKYDRTTHKVSIRRLPCEHNNTTLINVQVPSCFKEGYSGDILCNICESIVDSGNVEPKLEHLWDEGVVTVEPTYDSTGLKMFTCLREECSATKEVILSSDVCTHEETVLRNVVEPTCEGLGYTGDTYCMACDSLISNGTDIDSTGHRWDGGLVITSPTLTSKGLLRYSCVNSGCEKTNDVELPELVCEHYSTTVKNDIKNTCTSEGYSGDVYCDDCKSEISKGIVLPSLSHDWDDGTIIIEPTYTSKGKVKFTCKREGCTEELIEDVDKLVCNHINTEVKNLVEPTCNSTGYTGDVYCLDCEVCIIIGEVKSKLEQHTWGTDNKCTVCNVDKPNTDNPNTDNPTTDNSNTDNPNTDNPTTDSPTTDNPNVDKPTEDKPSTEVPSESKPTDNKTPDSTDNKEDTKELEIKKEIEKAQKVKVKISKVTSKKGKKVELKLKKQKGYKYEIQVSTNKKFKKSVKKYTTSKTSYTIKKLSKGKKYYIRVRTYKTVDGKKVYGKWSKTKSVKVKK